jgi:hypothetical protein
MNTGDGEQDFDAFLERELRRRVGNLRGPSPHVRQAAYRAVALRRRKSMPVVPSLLAGASSKLAVGLATAALAIGGGTVAAAAASTHSADPTAWGSVVGDAVTSCRDQLGAGEHGIGQCVSAVARKHGEAQRAAHAAQPENAAAAHPSATDQPRPHGSPTALPGGRPTGAPAGPPASLPPAAGGTHPTGPPVEPPAPTHSPGRP